MAYPAKAKVVMLQEDETTGRMSYTNRPDLSFTLSVSNPSEIVHNAKQTFTSRFGPDFVVRSCNLQGRKGCVLYCMPKEQVKNVRPMNNTGKTLTKSARRQPSN